MPTEQKCADCQAAMELHDSYWWHPQDDCPVIVFNDDIGWVREGDELVLDWARSTRALANAQQGEST